MLQKLFLLIVTILLLGGINAEAYFFSATDGPNLFLFKASTGSNGKISIVSELKYAAPGSMGATALLVAPGTTGTKRLFDLFGVFSSSGTPTLFSDRIEFDEIANTFQFVSRKTFPTHKIDSFNTFSAGDSGKQRWILTENGPNVNRRKVNSSGSVTGGNKPAFKNPTNVDPLNAALSANGNFAVQVFFNGQVLGIDFKDFSSGAIQRFLLTGLLINSSVGESNVNGTNNGKQDGEKCLAWREEEENGNRPVSTKILPSSRAGANRVTKTGVFYRRFDRDIVPIGNAFKIAKISTTPLAQHELFNTTTLLPDAKGILYGKHKNGKLEYKIKPLTSACGTPGGKAYPFLARSNPTVANNNPMYGWAAAACELDPTLC
jgi:hypothetical protein